MNVRSERVLYTQKASYAYVVEEEASHPSHEWAVNGSRGTAEEGPGILSEVRHRRVGVVEESEHNNPVVGE